MTVPGATAAHRAGGSKAVRACAAAALVCCAASIARCSAAASSSALAARSRDSATIGSLTARLTPATIRCRRLSARVLVRVAGGPGRAAMLGLGAGRVQGVPGVADALLLDDVLPVVAMEVPTPRGSHIRRDAGDDERRAADADEDQARQDAVPDRDDKQSVTGGQAGDREAKRGANESDQAGNRPPARRRRPPQPKSYPGVTRGQVCWNGMPGAYVDHSAAFRPAPKNVHTALRKSSNDFGCVGACHNRTVRSSAPETRNRPSGLNATLSTCAVSPVQWVTQLGVSGDIPQPNLVVAAARGERLPVGTERQTPNERGVTEKRLGRSGRRRVDVPHPDGAVAAAGGQLLAIGRECEREQGVALAVAPPPDPAAAAGLPDSNRPSVAAGRYVSRPRD